MLVTLREVGPDDREVLARLLADYLFEFDGRTEPYPYLDAYWSEHGRLPFLVDLDGETVGLCLIRVRGSDWQIAEFSVVPEQRRRGVGRGAVEALAARARVTGAGYLEAKIHLDNLEVLPFWLALGFREVSRDGPIVTRRTL